MKSNMQSVIMRRVYYCYAISIGTHIMFWQGMFLGVAMLLLAKWLHVAKVIHNFLAVPLGHVPEYVADVVLAALRQGEVVTVLTLVLAGGVAISAGYHLARALMPRLVMVRPV